MNSATSAAELIEPSETLVSPAPRCLNCAAELAGEYCARCGQRVMPLHPSLREVASEAWSEFANFDGKVATTLKALVLKPGFLTAEAIAGRRAPYVTPLRLYLTVSVLYFFLASALPWRGPPTMLERELAVASTGSDSLAARTRQQARDIARVDSIDRRSDSIRTSLVGARPNPIGGVSTLIEKSTRRAAIDRDESKRRTLGALPRLIFVLLPLAALLLRVAYETHEMTYLQHLYFALHFHAFAFVVMCAATAARHAGMLTGFAATFWPVTLALATYLVLALRRVYGGGVIETATRATMMLAAYALLLLAGFVAIIILVGLTM